MRAGASSRLRVVARSLEIHPAALAEAEGAARWYAERNPAAAEAFVAEVDVAVAGLEREPHIYPIHEHGTRRVLLQRFPFSVVYRFDSERILIVAFAHASRRPGYWSVRLEGG
jgi:plasmid stabilization system protein ParE